ncbi:radical SAM protein [Slackia isoflavoniconvertens]|uniref:radical SAM protein n=1 Tax=Slackia isoflavoniconvertens TaxID=572010 RepID=UPI003F9E1927
MDRAEYGKAFLQVKRDFEEAVAQWGLPFEAKESFSRRDRAAFVEACNAAACNGCTGQAAHASAPSCSVAPASHGAPAVSAQPGTPAVLAENAGGSIRTGWISPACVACRTGERTETFFVSLACTRGCYFCFNPNQEGYEHFLTHKRDIASELRQAAAAGRRLDALAVTGGEPCLHKPEVLAFLDAAAELYPRAHTRLYTSGDLLDDDFLGRLAAAGLREVRFSVKPDEPREAYRRLLGRISAAVAALPDVMVEMPVIPGTRGWMEGLLLDLDALGVRGVNLLEFCFPLHNAAEFARRGFRLRREPYRDLYNWWYGGGLPVAGSEAEALGLVRFAAERGLRTSVHYCSLDNKVTGQAYQQNKPFLSKRPESAALRGRYPHLAFDPEDSLLKCAKVFGADAAPAAEYLRGLGASVTLDPQIPFTAFEPRWLGPLLERFPGMEAGLCSFILEERDSDSAGSGGAAAGQGTGATAGQGAGAARAFAERFYARELGMVEL